MAGIFAFVPPWPRASTYLGCQAMGFAVTLLTAFALSRRELGRWLALPAFHRKPVSDLVKVGTWQLTAQVSGLIAGRADRYLLGALLAPQFVGFYTVAQRLEEAVYIGVLKIGEILFPFFSALQRESDERKADLLFRSSWVLNVLAASALGGLIPVAGPLLHLWIGAEVAAQTQRLLVVLSIAGMLGCTGNVLAFFLLASGRTRSNALISFVTTVFTLGTSAVALPYYGWQAAGWSACVGMVAQSIATTVVLRRSFTHAGMWSQVAHFVWLPLATGIVTALVLRNFVGGGLSDRYPHWWYVGSFGRLSGSHYFRRRCRCFANRTSWLGLPAGFAPGCRSLSSYEGDITMCGIAGIVNLRGNAVEQAEISRLTSLLQHRGPDGEGTWFSGN